MDWTEIRLVPYLALFALLLLFEVLVVLDGYTVYQIVIS